MVGRRAGIALGQFFEFSPEDIVHTQRLRDFSSDVAVLRPPGIYIGFLQQDQVRGRFAEKIDVSPVAAVRD